MLIAIILLLLGLFGFIPFPLAVGSSAAWLLIAGIGVGLLQRRVGRMPKQTGLESVIGTEVPAITNIGRTGQIRIGSETWNARTKGEIIAAGATVRIVTIDGLLAYVEPVEPTAQSLSSA